MARRTKRQSRGLGSLAARIGDEVSLATWFGGAAMGALGLRRGAEAAKSRRVDVEASGWDAWQPIQTAAIAVQVASGAALTIANRRRVFGQRGVASASLVRIALLGAAIGTTALTAKAGRGVARQEEHGPGDTADETRLRRLQWATVALTGSLLVMDAVMGEQQRPQHVARGMATRLLPGALASMNLTDLHPRDLHLPELHLPELHLAERLGRSA